MFRKAAGSTSTKISGDNTMTGLKSGIDHIRFAPRKGITDLIDHARNKPGDVHIIDYDNTMIAKNALENHLA